MTAVGDVIQPGQPIPDDVTAFTALDGDTAVRTEGLEYGAWSAAGCGPQCIGHGQQEFQHPLAVTAVREQPAVHEHPEAYAAAADLDTPVLVFRSASGRTEIARRAEGFSVHVLLGSDHLMPDEARRLGAKLARYPDTTPEPPQADAPVLDLVRQYGDERVALQGKYGPWISEAEQKVAALLDRIVVQVGWLEAEAARTTDALVKAREERDEARAALVPQQPVQARDSDGDPWWIHICGWVQAGTVLPQGSCGDIDCGPGPWRPLLVGGDPAPEQIETPKVGCPSCGTILNAATAHCADTWHADNRVPEGWTIRDGIQYPVAEILLDMQQREAQVMEAVGVDRPEDLLAAIADLCPTSERNEAIAELDSIKAEFDELASLVTVSVVDPLVLSLPEGAVALIGGRSGRRFTRVDRDGPKDWWNAADGRQSLGSVMDLEGTVRVELAPPPEPRTWPALKPGPDPVDLPQYVTVEGWGSYGLRGDGLYANTDGYPDDVYRGSCLTFAALRALGDVTEVTE